MIFETFTQGLDYFIYKFLVSEIFELKKHYFEIYHDYLLSYAYSFILIHYDSNAQLLTFKWVKLSLDALKI